MSGRMDRVPARIRRLAGFVGASFALHVATLISVPPSGVASAPFRGTVLPEPLHATLNLREHRGAVEPEIAPESAPQPREPDAAAEARAGVPGGAEVPFPDKWYTAAELDVRAEPLSDVSLAYPEELEGTGIPGRVRLLLFIDERGVVRRMQITDAEPARIFDKAATRAWTDVKFSPAKKAGVAVKSQKLLELDFRP